MAPFPFHAHQTGVAGIPTEFMSGHYGDSALFPPRLTEEPMSGGEGPRPRLVDAISLAE